MLDLPSSHHFGMITCLFLSTFCVPELRIVSLFCACFCVPVTHSSLNCLPENNFHVNSFQTFFFFSETSFLKSSMMLTQVPSLGSDCWWTGYSLALPFGCALGHCLHLSLTLDFLVLNLYNYIFFGSLFVTSFSFFHSPSVSPFSIFNFKSGSHLVKKLPMLGLDCDPLASDSQSSGITGLVPVASWEGMHTKYMV